MPQTGHLETEPPSIWESEANPAEGPSAPGHESDEWSTTRPSSVVLGHIACE